eukprot:82730_1
MSFCIWFITCFVASANVLQFELLNVTLPSPDYHFATAIYNNRLIITNGYNHQSPLSLWSTSDDLSSNEWEQHLFQNVTVNQTYVSFSNNIPTWHWKLFPVTRMYYQSNQYVQVNDKIFWFPACPFCNDDHLFTLDLNTFQFSSKYLRNWSKGIWEGSMTSDGQYIYILGDWNPHYILSGEWSYNIGIYNILSGEWSPGSSMLIPRGNMGCSASSTYDKNPEFIYIFGGHHAYGDEDSIERYDIKKDNWTMLPETLNYPRHYPQCLYLAQYKSIYCIDGRNLNSSLEIFNVGTETIQKNVNVKLKIQHPRNTNDWPGFSLVANEEWLLVLGGGAYERGSTDSIEGIYISNISTAPTKDPSKSHTFFSTDDPTTEMTTDPNLSNVPTIAPTITPSNAPTVSPLSSPTLSPTSTYKYLHLICHYNDDLFTLYGKFMTLFEYAAVMRNVSLSTIAQKTYRSTNYEFNKHHAPWRKAGISYFEFCNVFSTLLNDECPIYRSQADYIAIARFEIVADEEISEYKTHLFEIMSTESFRTKFTDNMNLALNQKISYVDRKRFETIKITVIDLENDEVQDTDINASKSLDPTISMIIGAVIGIFVTLIVFAVGFVYFGKRNEGQEQEGEGIDVQGNHHMDDNGANNVDGNHFAIDDEKKEDYKTLYLH